MEIRLKNLTVISALSYDTFVGFEAREIFDWEQAHVNMMQSSLFCGKASPTSWGRVESASSSLTRCGYIPYSYSFSAYRIIHLLLSHSKFPTYFENR